MFEHVPRDRLLATQPFLRYAPHSCVHCNHAANYGASSIAVAQPTYCCPQRFLVIVQMTGGTPQGKRNRVLCRDHGTVPQSRGGNLHRGALWKINGPLDSLANLTWWRSLMDLLQKLRGARQFRGVCTLPS